MKLPDDKVREIRERCDLVALVGQYVSLRRAGVNHLGLCPFHAERSPSFTVSAAKQFFFCFGCQKSGDVFRFFMDLEGRSFGEVARDLAQRAGVELPEESPEQRQRQRQQEDQRQRLLRVCEQACIWYQGQLAHSARARAYLQAAARRER